MFIGENEFVLILNSQYTYTKIIGDDTYEIVGYAGVLATDSWVKEQNYATTSYVDSQVSGKADASDLHYALSERKEWQYSGLPEGV